MKRAGLQDAALREVTIVIGFVNHPLLFHEAFDYFADLELPAGDLSNLRSAVLDIYAEHHPTSREELLAHLPGKGADAIYEAYQQRLRELRLWTVLETAAPEDAREAVRQALHLHHRFRSLNKELRSAEEALGRQPSETAYAHVVEVKREIDTLAGTEALIDGFGILSGRATKAY